MQPSPYTPGEVALTVPGRDAQIEAMLERLSYVSQFRKLAGRIRVDVGPRGVGKTSLLRSIQREADRIGFATVWITAGDGHFLNAIVDEFSRLSASWHESARSAVRAVLDELTITVAGVSVKAGASSTVSPQGGAGRTLQNVITKAAKQVTETQVGLAIFIDELQSADPDGLRAFAYAWQHLQSEAPDLPAVTFTAGLSHTQDVITDAVSFSERFRYEHMKNLDPVAARSALTAPARESGVGWEAPALEEALSRGQGYPFFIQLIGDFAWRAAGYPNAGSDLTVDHLTHALQDFEATQFDFFRARLTKATESEAKLMAAMASLGDGRQRRSDIAASLGVDTRAISMARRSLMDKGIIESVGHGQLMFTAPGFAKFMREHSGED